MKYILILVLLTFSICEDDKKKAVGSWEKHSFNENSLEIEQSFRQAAKDYCKTHDVEPDDLIRLTVYSQLVNGVNYKITFMDPNSEYPTIEEYRIYKARGNKPEDYKVEENTKYENTEGVISFNDPNFSLLENQLYKYLKETKEELDFISYVYPLENDFTKFYIINAQTKDGEHQYVACQDKSDSKFDSFDKIK